MKAVIRNPSYILHGLTMLMKWVEKEKHLRPDIHGTAINKVITCVENNGQKGPTLGTARKTKAHKFGSLVAAAP